MYAPPANIMSKDIWATIGTDLRRRWSLLTTLCVLSCSALLVLMRLYLHGFSPLPGVMRGGVFVLAGYLLLACFLLGVASLVQRGAATIVPGAILLLILVLEWITMVTAIMWLPFALTAILLRFVSWAAQ